MSFSNLLQNSFLIGNVRPCSIFKIPFTSARCAGNKADKKKGADKNKTDQAGCPKPTEKSDCGYICDMCALPGNIKQPKVVIVGAGMAGLSAAQRLVQCGITNFKVLEATERPGGRISSCWHGDTIVELGAEWIFGASLANPIYTMAAQERLLKPPLKRYPDYGGVFFTSDGRAISDSLADRVRARYHVMETKAAALFTSLEMTPYCSLSAFFDELVSVDVEMLPEQDRFDAVRVFHGLFNALKARVGKELERINPRFFGSLHEVPGGCIRLELGVGGLLAPLIRGQPDCTIEYCKPIECIRWGAAGPGTPRAVVRCCNGDEYPADYVIITVPLGVLKNTAETLFCPPLPAIKMDAIKNLGFGDVNKVFAEYDTPYWAAGCGGIQLSWTPEDLENKVSWVTGVASILPVPGSRKVVCVSIAGSEARVVEEYTDEEIIEDLTKIIRKFTGDSSAPRPVSVLRSGWSKHPYSLGAFTCMATDSSTSNIQNIRSPLPEQCAEVPPILLFAGEHTSVDEYSTLQGARRSGLREADRVVALTREFNGPPNQIVCPPCCV